MKENKMKQFHIDEPREIGKQKVKITKKDMMVKDKLQEKNKYILNN